jgi:nucleotide-binding universal stress UspA family protein
MFKRMLVPLDGSSLAECVLPHTVALARAFEAQVTLLRVLVCPASTTEQGPIDPVQWRLCMAEAEAYLKETAARFQEAGLQVDHVLLEGQPASQILDCVRHHAIDLIVLSSHGASGLTGWNVSSVVQKVLMRAHVSIMLVRAFHQQEDDLASFAYRRLLIPLDGSQRAEYILGPLSILARFYNAQLLLTHVVHRPEIFHHGLPKKEADVALAERLIEHNQQAVVAYFEQLRSQLDGDVQTHVLVSEDVALELHRFVEEEGVDLVVLCAHGYSGRRKWPYGGVAASFIQYGLTPLLIVQDLSPDEVEKTYAERVAQEHSGH